MSLKKIRFRFVIIVVCSLLCNLSVHAKKTGANKKSKKPIKLEKLNLTPEQIEKDKRIREKHSENAVKEYKALEYMKLKPITIKFSLGFITDKYDRNAKSNIWEHNSFKSPIINLGFYMNNFFSYGRLHLFYGADISYLESTEEIADGRVELKTSGILVSPEFGIGFNPRQKWFGFSGSLKVPLIRETVTEIKTATYRRDLSEEIGPYEVGIWAHWFLSPSLRPFIRYSLGEEKHNTFTVGAFYGF